MTAPSSFRRSLSISLRNSRPLTRITRSKKALTSAFPKTADHVASLAREAVIDADSLRQPLARCDLAKCQGTCCHDGVYLDPEEAGVLRKLVAEKRPFFEGFALDLPEKPIVYGKWRDIASGPKTATRKEPMSERTDAYPAHFDDTQCVFMLPDRRCSLQVLSESEGRHPWHYKPFTCWLHPLSIDEEDDGNPHLTLHNRETDPHNFPDYDGFGSVTPCGLVRKCGEPAFRVLAEEIAALSEIGGRDIAKEIDQVAPHP